MLTLLLLHIGCRSTPTLVVDTAPDGPEETDLGSRIPLAAAGISVPRGMPGLPVEEPCWSYGFVLVERYPWRAYVERENCREGFVAFGYGDPGYSCARTLMVCGDGEVPAGDPNIYGPSGREECMRFLTGQLSQCEGTEIPREYEGSPVTGIPDGM